MNKSRLVATFTGYYGMTNFGDDLFGLICVAGASRYWNVEARLASPQLGDIPSTMPRWVTAASYGAHNALGSLLRFANFCYSLAASDLLVLGGGSVIHSRGSYRQQLMKLAATVGDLRLGAVGISVGPFDRASDVSKYRDFLTRFQYISVRDRRSYLLAQEMGLGRHVFLDGDLAGLIPHLFGPIVVNRKKNLLGVALCNYRASEGYPAPDPKNLVRSLFEAICDIAKDAQIEVQIFSLNGHPAVGDASASLELHQMLVNAGIDANVSFYRGDEPLKVVHQIGRCAAFVSARLHGAIVAYIQGVPVTIVDYHPKCRDFAEDVGLPMERRISSDNSSARHLRSAISGMLGGTGRPRVPPAEYCRRSVQIFRRGPWW